MEQPVVIITGERITAVGPASQVRVPTGARIIDLAGATLMHCLFRAGAMPFCDKSCYDTS
jgi:predicted amidohydrolase YtcJ